jgi:hypothetical protein
MPAVRSSASQPCIEMPHCGCSGIDRLATRHWLVPLPRCSGHGVHPRLRGSAGNPPHTPGTRSSWGWCEFVTRVDRTRIDIHFEIPRFISSGSCAASQPTASVGKASTPPFPCGRPKEISTVHLQGAVTLTGEAGSECAAGGGRTASKKTKRPLLQTDLFE